jgi:signal transduction histidine kinase
LGLYIAREVARSHGGRIDVSSSAAEGTSFTVRLPRRGTGESGPPILDEAHFGKM